MQESPIYALDFDGVVCHSAIETAITGWKAAQTLWSDMSHHAITQQSIDSFCQLRLLIETGYEAILIMRYLQQGGTTKQLLASYRTTIHGIIEYNDLNIEALKALFGNIRDQWISHDKSDWLAKNPLFADFANRLRKLNTDHWYIITTKQERFVQQILHANSIHLDPQQIYGMDRKLSKQQVLENLLIEHPNTEIIFVEDRLPTLLAILKNPKLSSLKLQFAEWGYNTIEDQRKAKHAGIEVISIEHFLLDMNPKSAR